MSNGVIQTGTGSSHVILRKVNGKILKQKSWYSFALSILGIEYCVIFDSDYIKNV